MSNLKGKILWVDDEIDLLKPHMMFLMERGYKVTPVTNAEDAISLIKEETFDLVLLDEMMAGKDGLTALSEIKGIDPSLPVVMVTKSEEESLMEEAIGGKIDDYLTKPVNPSQILSCCKKILEGKRIKGEKLSRDYISEFNRISQALMGPLSWRDWIDIHLRLSEWEVELDRHPDLELRQILEDQRRECNSEFAKFIEHNYPLWVRDEGDVPPLSVDLVAEHLYPFLSQKKKVAFIVIDNLRLDQWLTIEPLLYPYYKISRDYYYSILPTATPFSRNAIFSGLFPSEIEERFPELWRRGEDDETSRNRYEKQFLETQLQKMGLDIEPKYIKILEAQEGKNLEKNISSYARSPLLTIVVNFVDILAHSRSTSEVLREIVPEESAYRSLTRSWFQHTFIFKVLQALSKEDITVILTSDHGCIRGMRGARVIGDRETSTNLRYKYGRNLKCDGKQAIFIKNPSDYKLPARGVNINYIIAKEDYYFVYPTNYHKYLSYYRNTFQHGGVSLEEMILPVARMEGR